MTTLNYADKVYIGTQLASAVYLGATKVWPRFKPTDLSGCRVWLDASQLGLANGAPVYAWPNLGTAGGSANGSGTPPPASTVRTNALNTNMPVVRIQKGNAHFRQYGTGVDKDWTLVYVGRKWALINPGRVIAADSITTGGANILVGFHGNESEVCYVEGWLTSPSSPAHTTQWRMYSADSTSTAVARFFSNGVLLASGATTPAKGWGGTLCLSGYDDAGTQDADCEIAELVMYNRKLGDAERQQVEKYLREKWAAPTLFKPTDLGNSLIGWFDASDPVSVQLAGSGVNNWANKGFGIVGLSQSTDASRPTYNNSIITMISPRAFVATNSPTSYDIALVSKPNHVSNGEWRTLLRSTVDAPHQIIIEAASTRLGTYFGGFLPAGGLTYDNVWGLMTARIANSAAVTISRDGGPMTTTTTALPANGASFGSFGAYQGPPISQSWGDVKEVIITTQIEAKQFIEGYLAHKHGLTSLLPAGHPYKTAPP